MSSLSTQNKSKSPFFGGVEEVFKEVKKILVIQQKMIGDVLTSSILFEALRLKYPNAELHYLINTHTYPVVKHNPFIDKFHFFSPKEEQSKKALLVFATKIKKENFDVVVDVYSKLSSNLITLRSKAKIKISKHKWYTSFVYTHTFKELTKPTTNAGLAIESRIRLLEPLGVPQQVIAPKIYLTEDEMATAEKYLVKNGIRLDKPLYMISLLGSGINKTYPFEYMAKLIDKIAYEKQDVQILFNYIPKQMDDAKSIFDLCSEHTKSRIYFNVFGKSLREFMSICKHCTAIIGNEGGAINMAKAIGIPSFSIFSPWIFKEVWNVFVDGNNHVSVHLSDYMPELFVNKSQSELKKVSLELYPRFTPNLFTDTLVNFLKTH